MLTHWTQESVAGFSADPGAGSGPRVAGRTGLLTEMQCDLAIAGRLEGSAQLARYRRFWPLMSVVLSTPDADEGT